ncbi:ser thr protein phosphatase family protein [Fusarium langsethiae]|uniref:Ser thr protein phosphatase family protein n=1 Tax=Fusarium langsethiae TaxID=179993 RepID=A0A0M9F3D7_FUSLA|nr:ser thr protein phosphatase family protein [Fusarium langsethiae]GKT99840.1 unnamed protein product [Fusarium langsethiae]
MSSPLISTRVKTRILIISDTHGSKPKPKNKQSPSTEDELNQEDVMNVITGWRHPLPETDAFEQTFSVLRFIKAPLKLAIAGNHDTALDDEYWINKYGGTEETLEKVKQIVREAEEDGVKYLTEGVHEFTLANGASLKVYASPWTPAYGGWAFQYRNGHDFSILPGIEVALTHGPPQGILDFAGRAGRSARCPELLAAVARAKPKIHCFGHIHEAWGMHHVTWDGDEIDKDQPQQLGLKGLRPNGVTQDKETVKMTRVNLIEMSRQRAAQLDLTQGESQLVPGEQTLFVNAAIMDIRYRPVQLPWLIDVDLEKADQSNKSDRA